MKNLEISSSKNTISEYYQYEPISSDIESNRSQMDSKITNVGKATIRPSIFDYESWNEESKSRFKACVTRCENCTGAVVVTSICLGYLGLMWYLLTHADPKAGFQDY